jgi:hypothetical protein
MSRLFITSREIHFVNDITKELIKDVIGQYIIYYPISTLKTNVHPVYDEAIEKIFEHPIKIEALVGQPEKEKKYNQFGMENNTKLEVMIQSRDLIDKQIEIHNGDFFVFDSQVFEILDNVDMNNIFGESEYAVCIKITAQSVRSGQIDLPTFKQLIQDGKNYMSAEVERSFEQQRGLTNDSQGNDTGDFRQIRDRLNQEMAPIALDEGPRKITVDEDTEKASSFYNEE